MSQRFAETHSIALQSLLEALWVYLTEVKLLDRAVARDLLLSDYLKDKPRNIPGFLKEGLEETAFQLFQKAKAGAGGGDVNLPARQAKHQQKAGNLEQSVAGVIEASSANAISAQQATVAKVSENSVSSSPAGT